MRIANLTGRLVVVTGDDGRFGPVPQAVYDDWDDHAAEAGFTAPADEPPVFTKFPSCITGPRGDITLPESGHTDWEVELVAVIGRRAERVSQASALSYVAGYAELRHRFVPAH